MAWRYLAQRLPRGEWLGEVPLTGVKITRSVSAPGRLSGTLPEAGVATWRDRLLPGHMGIWAEGGGQIRGGGILDTRSDELDSTVDCGGFSSWLKNLPWLAPEYKGIEVDPLDVVRRIWGHAQSYEAGDLGVLVDDTRSPVRIGEEERDVEFETGEGEQVEFTTGPYKLSWWETNDLGGEVDKLGEETPFDYLEETTWDGTSGRLVHRLRLAHPRIGARRRDLRFEIGVNVMNLPSVERAEYASEVLVLGAGEGSAMKRGHVPHRTEGLRRVAVVTDKSVTTKKRADALARAELERIERAVQIDDLTLIDHPNAPLGAIEPGDEVRLTGPPDRTFPDMWVRVMDVTIAPEQGVTTVKVVAP